MAKPTKTTAPASTTTTAPIKVDSGIDLAALTPAQLAALQKQLKEKSKEVAGKAEDRFKVIDAMLQEKDEDTKEFKHTTRDIMNALIKDGTVTAPTAADEQNHIKKIQARKQFLEKKRNEKGELVYPTGTYGYKASGGVGFMMTGAKITEWFTDENVTKLTKEQIKSIIAALSS